MSAAITPSQVEAPAADALPAPPADQALLTVLVDMPVRSATVAWSSADRKTLGLLNPVYEAAAPTWRGNVPKAPLLIYVDGLAENEALEAHGSVDLSAGGPATLELALREPRRLVTRKVVVRDGEGRPIRDVRGQAVLDGSDGALRTAVANYEQWWSDEDGALTVRSVEGEAVQLTLAVPLREPILHSLAPGESQITLRDTTIVRCEFRCAESGKAAPYPGFAAVAELKDGTSVRYEVPESDGLRQGPVMIAWPAGAKKLTVSSSPYKPVTLRSPGARCALHALPSRRCADWL